MPNYIATTTVIIDSGIYEVDISVYEPTFFVRNDRETPPDDGYIEIDIIRDEFGTDVTSHLTEDEYDQIVDAVYDNCREDYFQRNSKW